MEVFGRRPDCDSKKVSDEDEICQPCVEVGKLVAASKFCKDCQEDLCQTCAEYHTTFKALKHHAVVDISSTAQRSGRTPAIESTVRCSVHTNKQIEFYCHSHNSTVCGVCAVLDHSTCRKDYIPDISMSYSDSEEYRELKAALDQLEENVSQFLTSVKAHIQQTQENGEGILEEVRKLREDMNQYLKKKEEELISVVEKMRHEDTGHLNQVKCECELVKSEISELRDKLTNLEENSTDLFIKSKDVSSRTVELQELVRKCFVNNTSYSYRFEKGQKCLEILSARDGLGVLHKVDVVGETSAGNLSAGAASSMPARHVFIASAKVTRLPDIHVQSSQDRIKSYIRDMTFLLPSTLLLTDGYNMCVKSVDIDSNTGNITSHLRLSSQPWGITTVGTDQAVIAFPDAQKLQVISIKGGLNITRSIAVEGRCLGVDATSDKIIVSYEGPGKVQVLDYHGVVLHTVSTGLSSTRLFVKPWYVHLTTESGREVINVSDFGNNTITKMSMNGDLLSTFKDRKKSTGIVGVDGCLLVCSFYSDTVEVVSQDGENVRTLLKEADGLFHPRSVIFNSNILYVSCENEITLRVYRLN